MEDKEKIAKLEDDIEFLLSFAPTEEPHQKLLPLFYLTCTYEGDYALWERVKNIRAETDERKNSSRSST